MSTWTGPGRPVPGDVEGLGDDPRQLVGVTDEVVVLRHRQRDAVDVDLLEGVLADQRRRDVAGDRDHRHRIELGRPDAGDEVRGARPGGAHAHADPAGDAGVAVGGVGAALLVADEDVAELGVVAEDVVERQDHAARVAEEDVDALAEQRLAEDVGADARARRSRASWSISLRAFSTAAAAGGPVVRDVAAPGRSASSSRTRPRLRISLRDRHPWPSDVGRVHGPDKQKTLASRRGPWVSRWSSRLAALVPRPTVPPGAGNEAKKAIKPEPKRLEQGAKGYVETRTRSASGRGDHRPSRRRRLCGGPDHPDRTTRPSRCAAPQPSGRGGSGSLAGLLRASTAPEGPVPCSDRCSSACPTEARAPTVNESRCEGAVTPRCRRMRSLKPKHSRSRRSVTCGGVVLRAYDFADSSELAD